MCKKQSTPWWVWLVVVSIILFVIIVFVISFGTIEVKTELPLEFRDSRDDALKKHKALLAELNKKRSLKTKLDKRFKYSYLAVRVSLVLICSVSIYYIGYVSGAETLSDFLNYYESSIIVLFAVNFIAFGTIANFHDFIHALRTKVENWVWFQYIDLPQEIDSLTKEVERLNGQIENKSTDVELLEVSEVKQETNKNVSK